jgi:hypothetical protein
LAKIENVSGIYDTDTECFKPLEFIKYQQTLECKDSILDYPKYGYRGILVKRDSGHFKYDFPEYTELKSLRGNSPDILYRYLTFLNRPTKRLALSNTYPEYSSEFYNSRKKLYEFSIDVFNVYKTGNRVPKDHKYNKYIRSIYKKYQKNAEFSDVAKMIYAMQPKNLFTLIKTL